MALLIALPLWAQTTFRPIHVSAGGAIVDDAGTPVFLRGLSRSGTGSGNADATSTDSDYAAQNQLLSMNLVRIFVNATWWNNNITVPIGALKYQDYVDQLIQRAKKYGNYVLVLKAGQFPDAPCGADGKNCPAPNQGDLNCQANASVCAAQDTTGKTIDAAFTFWAAFAKKYSSDPAVLYDTWENMYSIDASTWADDQNQLIAAIRTYSPEALIFVEDTAQAFEQITAGTLPDLTWTNLVWNFHLFNASSAGCSEPASPRYANWSSNMDGLVSFAQQNGHALAFAEWGGCNDSEPYHTNIVSFAQTHGIALVYFDSSNLITLSGGSYQLTSSGTKVAQAYSALAKGPTGAPNITLVANAEGEVPVIAPNTWVELKGSNLAPSGDTRIWQGFDFFGGLMPTELDGVSATVNGKTAFVYFASPGQVNILTPPDAMLGTVPVKVTSGGVTSAAANVPAAALAPAFFIYQGTSYVLAEHVNGSLLGPSSLFPGSTTPAKPGETVVLYGNGFGPTTTPLVSGSSTQGGTLPVMPVITIGGQTCAVSFAGLIFPGEFQFNVAVPATITDGDQPIKATYGGQSTQPGTMITIQH